MSDTSEQNKSTQQTVVGLAKDVQEHLGKELRGLYNVITDKPAYLGDSALPSSLESKLLRLDTRISASAQCAEAVKEALFPPEQPLSNGDIETGDS